MNQDQQDLVREGESGGTEEGKGRGKGGGEGDQCEVEERGGGRGRRSQREETLGENCICLGKMVTWRDNEAYISITRGIIVLPVLMVSKRCSDPDTGAYERPAAVNARYLEHVNVQSGFVFYYVSSLWPSEKTCKRSEEFT